MNLTLYRKLIGASIRSQMEYKFSFIFSMLLWGLLTGMDFVLVAAILYKFNYIRGWNVYEIGYLYGITSISTALYRLIGSEIHTFEKYTVQGEFDQLLTKPVSPLLILCTRQFNLTRLGGVLQGVILVIFSLWGLNNTAGQFPWESVAYLPVAIVSGTMVIMAIGLATATIAFWTVRISELQVFTMYAPTTASNFPLSLYPGWLKGLLFTILPVAFVAYVPALTLFHKGGAGFNLILSPIVAIVALGMALKFWNWGIRHYHSTGS